MRKAWPASCSEQRRRPAGGGRLDWLADFLLPLGVFGLLGSLLYFLVDLRQYLVGGEAGLLRYVIFWFLVGVIFLSRIAARAHVCTFSPAVYSILLGGAVLLVIFSYSAWEGAFAVPGGRQRPVLALVLNVLTVAGLWVAAWFLTGTCTRPQHALEELRFGGLVARGGYARVTAAPLRAVLVVSGLAVAIFGYGLAILHPLHPLRAHAYACAGLYLLFALVLLALINLSAARLAAAQADLRIRRGLIGGWVGAALVLAVALICGAALLPQVAYRMRPRLPAQPPSAAWPSSGEGWGWGLERRLSRYGDGAQEGWGRRWFAPHPQSGPQPLAGQPVQAGRAGGLEGWLQAAWRAAHHLPPVVWSLLVALLLAGAAFWQRRRIWALVLACAAWVDRLLAALRRLGPRAGRTAPHAQGLPPDPWHDIFSAIDPTHLDPILAVRHVWRAVQVFYAGLGLARRSHETELEFARRVPPQLMIESAQVRRVAALYTACEYGQLLPAGETVEEMARIWRALQASVRAARCRGSSSAS
jgi:hypothetical protein